ncbi:MAG TPA: YesL family protein [Clostridiaceae bacterium]|nr:YesL family protein [Clostridiaceae bacterium]
MAGFFGFFDYTRPGPGIPKDAPPKPRIVVFFGILQRKFWNLIKINMLFMLFNIPAIIGMLLASMFIFEQNTNDPLGDLIVRFAFGLFFLAIPIITVGPAQAGFTYIMRNYAREEHAFLWWDFKDTALKNFKQSIIISIIDFVVIIVAGIAMRFYFHKIAENSIWSFPAGLVIVAFVIFIMMHLYIYPMLITFKLTVKQIYKNALIFAFIKLIPNALILLLCFAIVFATFLNYLIGILLLILITYSLIGLITNFYVNPIIKKYMIDRINENANNEKSESRQEEGSN